LVASSSNERDTNPSPSPERDKSVLFVDGRSLEPVLLILERFISCSGWMKVEDLRLGASGMGLFSELLLLGIGSMIQ
jgi:hypothetical protein